MHEIFYGAAIQGAANREERAHINQLALETIRGEGFTPLSEHTAGRTKAETASYLLRSIGPVPEGQSRSSFVRRAMLGYIDGPVSGFIFEASIPSTGTGVEIDHACTREQRGLTAVPILTLYEKDFWSHGLSTMVRGIEESEIPNFQLKEYENLEEFAESILIFLRGIKASEE